MFSWFKGDERTGAKVILVFFMLSIFINFIGSCTSINRRLGFYDDHPLEQIAERLIEESLDVEIDLTPESEK